MPVGDLAEDRVGVGAVEDRPASSSRTMKNCEPFEFGPASGPSRRCRARTARRPARPRSCSRGRRCRSPVGSPPWMTKPGTSAVEDDAVVEAARASATKLPAAIGARSRLDRDRRSCPSTSRSSRRRVSPRGAAASRLRSVGQPAAAGAAGAADAAIAAPVADRAPGARDARAATGRRTLRAPARSSRGDGERHASGARRRVDERATGSGHAAASRAAGSRWPRTGAPRRG